MNAEQLYEEGCAYRSRALENTQFTHVHSVDIEEDVFNNYFLPSAQQGYPPAIVEVAKYYMKNGEKIEGISWAKEYRRRTDCSRMEMIGLFGASFIL